MVCVGLCFIACNGSSRCASGAGNIVGGSAIALLWLLSDDLGATQCGAPSKPQPTTWNGRSGIWRRFGWHVPRLRQRESSSHGQVPGLCITVMMQFHKFRRGLAPGALRRDHCQHGMVRKAADRPRRPRFTAVQIPGKRADTRYFWEQRPKLLVWPLGQILSGLVSDYAVASDKQSLVDRLWSVCWIGNPRKARLTRLCHARHVTGAKPLVYRVAVGGPTAGRGAAPQLWTAHPRGGPKISRSGPARE